MGIRKGCVQIGGGGVRNKAGRSKGRVSTRVKITTSILYKKSLPILCFRGFPHIFSATIFSFDRCTDHDSDADHTCSVSRQIHSDTRGCGVQIYTPLEPDQVVSGLGISLEVNNAQPSKDNQDIFWRAHSSSDVILNFVPTIAWPHSQSSYSYFSTISPQLIGPTVGYKL